MGQSMDEEEMTAPVAAAAALTGTEVVTAAEVRRAYELSADLLADVEDLNSSEDGQATNPRLSLTAFIIALGRLAAAYGLEGSTRELAWRSVSGEEAQMLFHLGFDGQRAEAAKAEGDGKTGA